MSYELHYKRYSENAILIEWPAKIDKNIHQDIIFYKNTLEKEKFKEIVEVIISYNSLLIFYKSTIEDIYNEVSTLKLLYSQKKSFKGAENKLWKIPVCYSPALAPDLESFCKAKGFTIGDVIDLHTAPIYQVYFLGFLPGFFYLGGLDKKLNFVRKNSPSLDVKKGSVAIGGNQTGVYPQDSPGGWHVIGRCPLNFFDPEVSPPCYILPKDKIQFISISENGYNDISSLVNLSIYTPESVSL
ncbi:5-oxoprolinase subunit PxpB [Aquimarina gracilis]|uniref:5-oxoprolinase subunit PxpB n=1 Tax=Aquimarina gracilis TaxID=874422 RepID=A0ABU5ZVK0_9FLAO|nr:5-oxoprolinase subunit PxpB [Aquimarina gracilis]MEB3345691.1 5-oxoprolinase subunit PxpB [Aquimarina gracilis]